MTDGGPRGEKGLVMGDVKRVDAKVVRGWVESGEAAVVDVRERDEFAREHIAGARLAPLSQFDAEAVRSAVNGAARLVTVCKSGRRAAEAAGRLEGLAGSEVVVMEGGMDAWKKAGLPVEGDPRAPIPIMRQVQITAGTMVFAGTLLAAFVSPWWLIVPGFVGAGLVFAGVSGTCGMAAMLEAMPWNRRVARSGRGCEGCA